MDVFSGYTPVKATRMAVSQVYTIMWTTATVFLILPHLNLALLSDYKICGDSECESLMSRVQAIRDHRGKDCRFLSFRQGDIIFVYHKLSGKREDLWAGSIDKQFGYFPKDAVQEEQVHATVEKVVETQKSDFFCMDEFGYPIDSSYLDSDDDKDDDDDDPKIPNQESEITQTTTHPVDTNAEIPSTSEDPSTESPVSAEDADGTSTEEEENQNARDAAVGIHEEARETPAALNKQGGSAPSSWLGSSVTGWLGLAKEEEAGNLVEGEKKDERKEMQAEASVTSSVTGWLGFGGEGKPDDAVKSREEDRETADSFTSTMTGWLGFGGEKQTDHPAKEEQTEEREDDEEPAETFRSRRISLDLEGSQLHEEEKKEMGTLGWLGNGLSSTLGFGLTNQESGPETTPEIKAEEKIQEEEEQQASGSWLEIGIRDILGYRKDKSEVDESTGSDFKETEEDKTLEQPTFSENMNTSQLQPVLTEEVRKETSNESKVGETPKDQNAKSEIRVNADSNNNDTGTSDSSKDSVLPKDAASKVDEKDIPPQTMESMEGKEHQMLKSLANEREDNNREPGEEESNTASGTDQDFLTQSDISLGPDGSFSDLNLNSIGQSVGEDEKDNTEDVVGEGPEIRNQIDNTEESTDTSVTGAGSDGHEGEGNNAETDVLHREVPTTQTDDTTEESQVSSGAGRSSGKSQPSFLSSGTAEERNEPTSDEDNTLPAHSVETDVDHSDSLAMIDNNTERETRQGELGEEGISQEFGSAHSTNRSTETMYGNASEEDRRTFSTSESTGQMDNNADQDSVSPDMQQGSTQSDGDAHELEETVEETETDGESNLRPVQTETTEFQKDMLNESGLKSAIGSESEEVEESKEEEKLGRVEELKEEGTQQDMTKIKEEGKQEVKEIKEEEKQQEVKETKEEEKLGGIEELKKEEKQREVKEIKEEGKQEEKEELKEGEQQQGVKEIKEEGKKQEVEETKEWRKQEEIEKLKEEKKQEVKDIKEEGKQEEVDESKEKKKQEKVEEIKEEDNQEEEGGEQGEEEELNEERKKVEVNEGKKKEIEGLKEEEKMEELKEVERAKEQEKKEGEEKRVQSHLEEVMENSIHSLSPTQKARESPESESSGKETHGENSSVFSEMSTKTQKRQAENPQMDEEKREGEIKKQEEVKEKQETENLEGERRTKGKEGSLKCSSELCPQASEDKFVGVDSVNKLSSTGEGTKETGKQNPVTDNDPILADRTGVSQMVPVDDTERDKDVSQEEGDKTGDDAEANEEREEQVEQKNKDLLHSGVSDQNSLPNQLSLSQTAENKEDDQLYSSEADNTELSDDNVLPQGDKTKSEDTETSSKAISTENETEQIHTDYMMDTVEDTDREEREINVKHEDVRVNQGRDVSTGGTVFRTEEGMEISVSSSDPVERQAVLSEQTAPRHPSGSSHLSDGHNKGAAETGSAGAFGLFKNAFSFFTETKESPESAPSLDSDTGEIAEAQASLPPEQGRDSTTDSSQVHMQDVHTDSPITLSPQQLQPLFTETQTSSPSPTQTRSHPSESSIPKKTLTKHYKNLLIYMSAYETTIMMELFGRHKLQFLDYILGSSETPTDDPDNDESILLDIERLLRYHRETLVAPSMRLTDAPQEDKEKTTSLIALQKLEMLLARVRETFNTAEASCVGESCSSHSKDKEMATEEDPSVCLDNHSPRDKWMGLDEEKDGGLSGGAGKEMVTEDKKKEEKGKRSGGESVSPESCPPIQPGSPQSPEGVMNQILDFVHQIAEDSTTHVCAVRELLVWLTEQVVSTLPDDIRPGPDLYGVPWEPVIITSVVGLVTMLLFTCRCYSSVKSRMYRGKERRMAEQVAQLLDEKCKVLETLSKCQQEYDDLESSLRDSGVLAQTQKTEHLEVKARQLEHAKRELDKDLEELKDQLDQQREHRIEQEKRIAVLEESMKTFEEETKDLQSQEEQAQTTLKVYNMNSDRLQRNLETAGEENTLLQESNAQLRQQVEGWAERVSELEAEMSRCEVAHGGMLQDVANKDERIMSLTDRLLSMKAWDSDLEEEEDEEGEGKEASNGTAGKGKENGRGDILDTQGHLQKVQKLIYAAKLNADLKSVDEDKDRLFAKLNDEVKAKEDLQARIEELDNEKLSLQSDTEQYSDQVQRLQQKLQIMTEMYQENELKLHRLLTVEEKERMQKEEKLNKADKNITMAMEELSNYRQRAGEMEEELEKTKQSYQTQISAHEKKAHNNWLAARAAERELADIRRENALFRQKLTDTQFKLDALDKDPYALDSLARPLPFRAERSPYGPSPLGRPASETRAFLSPPTLMDGPPARLSPRVTRGPLEPTGGHGEMERSGGPHSDSGSNSPTWERDRRAPPPGPPGYMFPEQGGPMFRRPPPGALGLLPPPGPLHPRGLPPLPPHPADMADVSYRENSHGPGEQEHRESGPGDRRTPPEMDPRMGGAPPPGPPMGPMDGPYPRRSPYGPPPPDFYPPRGPGGPTMMPMWAPPPPGMMFPPRFPPGGPPHPHFAPPMRPPFPDGHLHPSMGPPPPQQPLPSPPHSQSPEEHTPSPEDAI